MATTTIDTAIAAQAPRTAPARIATLIGSAFALLGTLAEAGRAARRAARLSELTDEHLAALGLTRDGIVDHAFRNLIRN